MSEDHHYPDLYPKKISVGLKFYPRTIQQADTIQMQMELPSKVAAFEMAIAVLYQLLKDEQYSLIKDTLELVSAGVREEKTE